EYEREDRERRARAPGTTSALASRGARSATQVSRGGERLRGVGRREALGAERAEERGKLGKRCRRVVERMLGTLDVEGHGATAREHRFSHLGLLFERDQLALFGAEEDRGGAF